jgi:hypothetical protein
MTKRVTVLGTGLMGAGMARNLTRIPHAAEHIPHRVPSTGILKRHGRSASVCVHEEAVIQGP